MPEQAPPDIFRYVDHHTYLKHWYAWKQESSRRGYSLQMFSTQTKLPDEPKPRLSKDGVFKLLRGRYNPGDKAMPGLVRALRLDTEQEAFFQLLVDAAKARSLEEHSACLAKIFEHEKFFWNQKIEGRILEYLSRLNYVAIREMAVFSGFSTDPEWIRERLVPAVEAEEVEADLGRLQDLGILDDDGRPVEGALRLGTAREVAGEPYYLYHRMMIQAALNAMNEVRGPKRSFEAATITVSRERYEQIRTQAAAFVQGMLNETDALAEDDEVVVQLNVQLFPLAWGAGRDEVLDDERPSEE